MSRQSDYPWRFALFMAFYYTANAVYQGFISVYFAGKGLNSAQIGMLMSAVPVISVISQPAWGALGDRAKSRNRVLRIMCALSAAAILLLLLGDAPWYLFGVLCLFAANYTAIQPMGDSVILESLQASGHAFGPIRLMGCFAFAVASTVAGRLIGSDNDRIIWMTSLLIVAAYFSTYSLPPTVGHAIEKKKASMLTLMRDKTLMRLIVMVTLLQVTMGYYYVFFPVHFTSIPGGSAALLGGAYFISALSETPFLLMSDWLFKKLGAGKLLCIAALSLVLRWTILFLTDDVRLILASQMLHGWGFIIITVAMAKFISLTVPEELRARGQMLLAVSGFGVARVVGNMGGGLIAQAWGFQATFGLMAALALATLILLGPKYLKEKPLNGR
jgi:PPP family 3-phenylpropionic acid transporter